MKYLVLSDLELTPSVIRRNIAATKKVWFLFFLLLLINILSTRLSSKTCCYNSCYIGIMWLSIPEIAD